jgi:hypothetical protein
MNPMLSAVLCVSLLPSVPLLALGLIHPLSTSSESSIVNPAISFGLGYALPSAYWIYGTFPTIGDNLGVVGKVAAFQAPFADLNAADPGLEFTYRMRDLTVVGTAIWDDFEHNEGGIGIEYSSGVLEIYRDTTPDADFANTGTFADGEMILSASITSFWLILYSSYLPAQSAALEFTGGTLFDRVSENGVGFTGTNQGDFRMFEGDVPASLVALGYNARSETTINIDDRVPVETTTWGRLKATYAGPTAR